MLVIVDKSPKLGFNHIVLSLGLAISLKIKDSRELWLNL